MTQNTKIKIHRLNNRKNNIMFMEKCEKHKKEKCESCKLDLITDKMLNGNSLTLKDILDLGECK